VEVVRATWGACAPGVKGLILNVVGEGQREADEVVVVPLHQKGAIREWLSHRMPFADQRPEAPIVFPSQWETRLGVSIALQCWYNFLKGQ